MPKKGKEVRPIISSGVSGKRFRPLVHSSRRVAIPADPSVVVKDLRMGSLNSLCKYLQQNRGIPDRKVALELRKLLSGSASRTKFRLVVVDHPDRLPDGGGRPKARSRGPNRAERELFAEYLRQLELIGKKKEARLQTAGEKGVSETTVRDAIKVVEAELEIERLRAKREHALETLRRRSRSETS